MGEFLSNMFMIINHFLYTLQLTSTYDHLCGLLNDSEKAQYQSLISRIVQSPGYNKVKNDIPEIKIK